MGESPETTDSRTGGRVVGQDTAMIGVVIAGLLSAFLVPGPFMMIGLLLLVILGACAYLTPASFRHPRPRERSPACTCSALAGREAGP
jgi:hypothetical protein